MIKELEKLGLNNNEARIYSICIKKGQSSAFKIAKATTIPTTTVYHTLEKLSKKGLISAVPKKGKKFYEVNDPKLLTQIKEDELESAKKLIPLLRNMYMGNIEASRVRHFTEIDDIRNLLDEMLEKSTETLVIGSIENELNYFSKYFPKYIEKRIQKRVPVKIITNDTHTSREIMKKDIQELRQTKIIEFSTEPQSVIYIWDGQIIIISFDEKVEITSIENKFTYEIMKSWFESTWRFHPKKDTGSNSSM